ncbi:MAG: SDR family oxidoreductase [Acidobacteriota bacterium]|nr:SDR family oxidoreductase [Acidobacteriota bacterium]
MPEEKPWWILVGGMRRLGRALAEELAQDHALVLTGSEGPEAEWLKDLALRTSLRTCGWNAMDPEIGPQMMADLGRLEREGIQLTGAVVVAGVFPEQPMGTWTMAELEPLWRVNVGFPMLCAQALAPRLAEGSCLQFLLDTCIHRPFLKRLPYSASKAGLASLVPGLAQLLAPRLRVVGHAIGTVLPDEASDPQWLASSSLLGRSGNPGDLARALRFASESDYLTGEIITLDGGRRWGRSG